MQEMKFVRFPTTLWNLVSQARRGQGPSLDQIIEMYRPALLSYIMNRGYHEHEAEDIVQEVLARMSQPKFLQKAHQEKGRFRSLLLAVTNHVMMKSNERERAQKRGGAAKTVSIDDMTATQVDLPDRDVEQFDRYWMENLMRLAMEKLKQESARRGKHYYDALKLQMGGKSYKEISAALKVSLTDVTNYCHQGKKLLKKCVREVIASYASSNEEYDEEVKRFV